MASREVGPKSELDKWSPLARLRAIVGRTRDAARTEGGADTLHPDVGGVLVAHAEGVIVAAHADGYVDARESMDIMDATGAVVVAGVEGREGGVPLKENPVAHMLQGGRSDEIVQVIDDLGQQGEEAFAESAARLVDEAEQMLEQASDRLAIDPEIQAWASQQADGLLKKDGSYSSTAEDRVISERVGSLVRMATHPDMVDALYVELERRQLGASGYFPKNTLGEKAAIVYISGQQGEPSARLMRDLLTKEVREIHHAPFKQGAVSTEVMAEALSRCQEAEVRDEVARVVVGQLDRLPGEAISERFMVQLIGSGKAAELQQRVQQGDTAPLDARVAFAATDAFGPSVLHGTIDLFEGLDAPLEEADRQRLMGNYYQHNQSLKDVEVLEHFGVGDSETAALKGVCNDLLQLRPEMAHDNPALNGRFLRESIVSVIGSDILNDILDYRSGAEKTVVRLAEQGRLEQVVQWVQLVQESNIYQLPSDKLTHYAIHAYEDHEGLAETLASAGALNELQQKNLSRLLRSAISVPLSSPDDLARYHEVRKERAADLLEQSTTRKQAADAIAEGVFGVPSAELSELFAECMPWAVERSQKYSFDVIEVTKTLPQQDKTDLSVFKKKYGLDDNDMRALSRASEFMQVKGYKSGESGRDAADRLRQRFAWDMSSLRDYDLGEVRRKIASATHQAFSERLHAYEHRESGFELRESTIPTLSGDGELTVRHLDGDQFALLIHKIHCYDPKQEGIASRLSEDPSLWSRAEGSSTLSTSYITHDKIDFVGSGSSQESLLPRNNLYYGFSDIEDSPIVLMGPQDIYVSHGAGVLDAAAESGRAGFMSPYELQQATEKDHYNEVALDRGRRGDRLLPSSIICFGNSEQDINDASKRAAEHFGVPIQLIDRERYRTASGYRRT